MTNPIAVNTHCPWSGDVVSDDSLTAYRGYRVGFCNPGCRDKFDRAVSMFDREIDHQRGTVYSPWRVLANYNRSYNETLLSALSTMPESEIWQDRGIYFKSIGITLNHIMVWDLTWLRRIHLARPEFVSLVRLNAFTDTNANDQILYEPLGEFAAARRRLDSVLTDFAEEVDRIAVDAVVSYMTKAGQVQNKTLGGLVQHLFNHQTHHRGQITAVLSQVGADYGVTDMLVTLPDV